MSYAAALPALAATIAATASSLALEQTRAATPLEFRIDEGRVTNAFFQQGPIAAHLLLTSGTEPRVLVAFPAGNSGVGVWFEKSESPVSWTLETVEGTAKPDARNRTLRGIVAHASIDSPLVIPDAVLSSVRVLRDYQLNATYPAEVKASTRVEDGVVTWSRDRLDGAAGYALTIQVENGTAQASADRVALSPSKTGQPMRLAITALTGETPLTPIPPDRLLNTAANDDARSRNVLRFLAYEEKFLAGSWRFDTYFGRDTLMSLRLLMPTLQPEAIERGLMSVLQRLAPDGEVAHEEDIGEFAVLRHLKQGEPATDSPIYDYKMIDDDFMLAPIAAAYLLGPSRGADRASSFLNVSLPSGEKVGAALVRNFIWAIQSAAAFAQQPRASNLILLKAGINVGDWRDSEHGLAGGRYPFDVNAVLVPAAIQSIADLYQRGLLTRFISPEQKPLFERSRKIAAVWTHEAPSLFRVSIPNEQARRRISDYATSIGVDPKPALQSVGTDDIVVNAIALDAQGHPIPVVNSDAGFALLFQNPSAHDVRTMVAGMLRPFPAGLLTNAGLLVANPVFADTSVQNLFNRNAYHGTVAWSWQQALLAAGLAHQLSRTDLPATTMQQLHAAQTKLHAVIAATRDVRSSELWSWRFVDGHYEPVPFGQSGGDADESNAAQLWSTVYLAIGH